MLVYELRNSEIRREAAARIGALEPELFLRGRVVTDRSRGAPRLFFVIPLEGSLGLALVYGAALAGWGYLVSWGALAAAGSGDARRIGIAIGAVVGLLVLGEVLRLHSR